jgi:xanthine dehydrogenase small subunit
MSGSSERIDSMKIAYGGVGPMVLRLPRTEAFLKGKHITLDTFSAAGEIAREEISPITDVRGSEDFRRQLASNILKKFFYDINA